MSVANERLEKLSMTDSLTGLLNWRKFDELSLQQWNISKQNSSPISIIMSDIDSFKRYNDHFGHQIGDECILQIANAITKSLRSSTDYAARYGGDEFIIILADTEIEAAYQIAERLRKSVENLHLPLGAENDCVTISVGISSTIPTDNHSIQELVSAADQALYKAKSQNKNKSVFRNL